MVLGNYAIKMAADLLPHPPQTEAWLLPFTVVSLRDGELHDVRVHEHGDPSKSH